MNELIKEGESTELAEVVDIPYPTYSWKQKNMILISKTERFVADKFLDTGSYKECDEVLKRDFHVYSKDKAHRMPRAILARDKVKEYMLERLEEKRYMNGWSKERWIKVMTEHLQGVNRLKKGDEYAMKLVGDALGYTNGDVQVNLQVPINFTQADGSV